MNYDKVKEALREAQEAESEALEEMKRAQAALRKAQDDTRAAWVALKDAEWVHTYSKQGHWLSSQRFPEGKPAKSEKQ